MYMKEINTKKVSYRNTYIFAIVGMTIILLGLLYAAVKGVNAWFETHRFVFKRPVEVTFNKPISIEERRVPVAEVVKVIQEIPHPDDLETDIEIAIYEKWGLGDYKVALAIAKSESGLRPDAINAYNSNGTIDLGLYQINSTHYDKSECSLEKVVTVQGNIDCAYMLWQEQGWNPWVVFQNGSFKNKLE